MTRARPATALTLALALAGSSAPAQTLWSQPVYPLPPGTELRAEAWPVGPGMRAEKVYACGTSLRPAVGCQFLGWRPVGFTFGARADLHRALTFSGDGRGRVLASTERDVLWSDDRGRTWQRAAWNGVNRPQVIAMEPATRFGVAAAEGAIHVTEDGGASWRFVRELPSRRLVQAVVQGRNAVLADAAGGLWALVRAGELHALSESGASQPAGAPRFHVEDGAIVATDGEGRVTRVTAAGSVERAGGATWWGR